MILLASGCLGGGARPEGRKKTWEVSGQPELHWSCWGSWSLHLTSGAPTVGSDGGIRGCFGMFLEYLRFPDEGS